ncbi:MAG: YgiT-type zinc finger protein [Elusimicrobia bacterium]|nr:YgiT-type zinc finger protein [Elusimicrobiota bacterium]
MIPAKKAKPCPECKQPMAFGHTTLHFERKGFYADVENVSAYLCSHCGTRSIPGPIASKISEMLEELFKRALETEPSMAGHRPAFTGLSLHKVAG